MSTTRSYTAVAKFLHWTIALAILGMIFLGWYMEDIPRNDPLKFPLFQWHKSIGITILLLSLFRLGWRWTHPAPPLPPRMKVWEKRLARFVVVLFYVLMIGIPFLGWAVVSSSPLNIPTLLYGFVPWPHLPILPTLENKREISHTLGDIHGYLAYSVLALLCLHVAGALKHHFITRDDTLTRMMPKVFEGLFNRLRR
jgi:cytochrome b561